MFAITKTGFRSFVAGMILAPGESLVDVLPVEMYARLASTIVRPPIIPHTPEHYRAIRSAVWAWMTAYVQARRYDTIESCCSYANSAVTRYRAEALAMIAWRDAVNQALEALVVNPPDGLETWEQVQALLPQPEAFAWPAEVDLPLGTETASLTP